MVLVEGESERIALQTLAARTGRDLTAEGVEVVAMGGITNTRAFASRYGPLGSDVPLSGLYDAPDEAIVRRGLAASGLGETRSLRLLERMPAQRGWSREALLHRFLGVRSGRKARYARLLVEALEPDRAPPPLVAVLAGVGYDDRRPGRAQAPHG